MLGSVESLRFTSDGIAGVYEYQIPPRHLAECGPTRATGVELNTNQQLIESFYLAFQQRDASGMAACYDTSIHFSDPVFTNLNGLEVDAMWAMLCEQGEDLNVEFSNIEASDQTGSAHWVATYTLAATGRVVENSIDAAFEFQDGKIIRHVDEFNLWKWSRMALGISGTLGGWLGPVQMKIRETANRALAKYIDSHPEYQEEAAS